MKKNRYSIIAALSVVGILLAVYLLVEQYTQAPSICSINATINCNAIISGPVAKTLGIPTPLYGLLGYIAILCFALLKRPKSLVAMASGGLAFCLYIAYQELVVLHVLCPICVLCQLIMLSVFALSVYAVRSTRA
jgi:uncharacterized membrane protein